jgi:hypothetical protein
MNPRWYSICKTPAQSFKLPTFLLGTAQSWTSASDGIKDKIRCTPRASLQAHWELGALASPSKLKERKLLSCWLAGIIRLLNSTSFPSNASLWRVVIALKLSIYYSMIDLNKN